jgi:hypothetical protein
MLGAARLGETWRMFEKERDEAIRQLEEFQKTIDEIKANSKGDTAALDKAKAQAARIAERLRNLQGVGPSEPTDDAGQN